MKYLLLFIFSIFLFSSCWKIQVNNQVETIITEIEEEKIIEIFEPVKNTKSISKKSNSEEKIDYNIQENLFQWTCKDWFKYWKNKKYSYEICIPNNWDAISSFWWTPAKFHDFTETIWEFKQDENWKGLVSSIAIWPNKSMNIGWFWTTDTRITNIEKNKLFVDWFERLPWNELVYKWTFLHLQSWWEIIVFFYNKNNSVHVEIIEWIKLF